MSRVLETPHIIQVRCMNEEDGMYSLKDPESEPNKTLDISQGREICGTYETASTVSFNAFVSLSQSKRS